MKSLLFAAVITCTLHTSHAAQENPPNLIVIMTDDQGYADVGFNGCKDIPTPHIDSIANHGVRFTDGYVSYSVCSPSRAGFLTGRYQQRFGFERNPRWAPHDPKSGLPLSETSLAEALGKVGYKSGIIGKWHLGSHPDLHPLKRGFTEFFGHLGGGHRYFPEELTLKETHQAKSESDTYRLWIMRNQSPVKTTDYLTDEFSNEAVRFIERHKSERFFLYLAYNAPHAPLQASEKYLARFAEIKNKNRRTYAAMVSAVDDGVGQVLAKLQELGIDQNTMVVFLSDNGGATSSNSSNNTPLAGEKGSLWEGGIRVPFAMQWPARIPKGLVYRNPVISLDIFASITALANAPIDPQRPLDGVNLIPYLTGQNPAAPHSAIYFRMFDKGGYAVRSGDHKLLIESKSGTAKFFNLRENIGETEDLSPSRSKDLQGLNELRLAWDAQLIAPVFEGLAPNKNRPRQKLKAQSKNN